MQHQPSPNSQYIPTTASERRRAKYLGYLDKDLKLGPRARRAGILLEVKAAKGAPLTRKYLADRLNSAESLIKHDIEWLLKEGKIEFVKHAGNKGAIYKAVALRSK